MSIIGNGNVDGTSYHGVNIITTPQKLIDFCNANNIDYWDQNGGEDKTNFDFDFQLEDGTSFTVYDWKEYRQLDLNELVDFHIGGNNRVDCIRGRDALRAVL